MDSPSVMREVIDLDLIASSEEEDDSDIEVIRSLTKSKGCTVDLSLDTPTASRTAQTKPESSSSTLKTSRSSSLVVYDSEDDAMDVDASIASPSQILRASDVNKMQERERATAKKIVNAQPLVAQAIISTEQIVLTPYARRDAMQPKRNFVDLSTDSDDDMQIDTSIASPSQLDLPVASTSKPPLSRGEKKRNVVDLSIESDDEIEILPSVAKRSSTRVPVASTSKVTLDAPETEEHRLAAIEAKSFRELVQSMADGKPEPGDLYLLADALTFYSSKITSISQPAQRQYLCNMLLDWDFALSDSRHPLEFNEKRLTVYSARRQESSKARLFLSDDMLEVLARFAALHTTSPADHASWLPNLSNMTTARGHTTFQTLHISETPFKKRLAKAKEKPKIKINPIVANTPNRRTGPVLRPRKSVVIKPAVAPAPFLRQKVKSPQILKKKRPAFARKTPLVKTAKTAQTYKMKKAERNRMRTGIAHGKPSQGLLRAARVLYDQLREYGGSVVSIDTEGWQPHHGGSMSEVGLEFERFQVSEIDGRLRKAAGARHCKVKEYLSSKAKPTFELGDTEALPLHKVTEMVYEYLGDTNKPLILLAHAHHAETSMLCQTMKFASNRFHNLAADPSETFKQGKITLIDTQVLFASLNLKARLNLKACCERMELPVRTGYHNAANDAYFTMNLFRKVMAHTTTEKLVPRSRFRMEAYKVERDPSGQDVLVLS